MAIQLQERQKTGLHNTSEIGRLRKVLLHRPGRELENLTPDNLERLLFDDIPYLPAAQAEHDAFAGCLRDRGVEVVYLRDLVEETIRDPEVRAELIEEFLDGAEVHHHRLRQILREFFSEMDDASLVDTMIAGVRKSDIRGFETGKLSDYLSFRGDSHPFLIDPMPNLYFTRDPFAVIGSGVSLHRMHAPGRRRESIFGKFIFQNHPLYRNAPKWYDGGSALEGGDILVLSPEVIAVGISQRSRKDSVEAFARTVLSISPSFRRILAFDIPKARSFMHLDTVFTMVDYDKFLVHPNILQNLEVFSLEMEEGCVRVRQERGPLEDILQRRLHLDRVTLIPCGSGSPVDAAREQWSDGSNTLAIAPGEVVAYARNDLTNRILEDHGVLVHALPCGELSRGRGGPHCMSMPFIRDEL